MAWDNGYEAKWGWHAYTNRLNNLTPTDTDYLGDVEFPTDRDEAEQWIRESLFTTNCPFAWIFSNADSV